MNMPDPGGLWTTLGAAVAGVIGGALWIRGKLSRDAANMANDRAEVIMIDRLLTQNQSLQDLVASAHTERLDLMNQISHLSGKLTVMTERTTHLEALVEELRQEINRMHDRLGICQDGQSGGGLVLPSREP